MVERIWKVIEAFASFGFCKAHAAAFALPTYQSAWLKAHYPAHFLSGVLTHDPGMYPKRLILDDARQLGIAILGLDVNASEDRYVVERRRPADRGGETPGVDTLRWSLVPVLGDLPPWTGVGWGIRLSLADVKGITGAEVARIVAAREGAPYASLTDFWQRARVSRPVAERLVLAGAFDTVYGIGATGDRCAGAAGSPGATCCSRSPTSTGTAGRWSGPRAVVLRRAGVRHARSRSRARRWRARRDCPGVICPCASGRRPSPGPRGRPHRSPRCSSRSTSATDRPRGRAAGCRR